MPRWARPLLCGKLWLSLAALCAVAAAPTLATAAAWQYYVPFETGKTARGGEPQPGKVFLWLPPEAKTIRGVLVGGQLGIELEISLAPEVRRACAENDLAIICFVPHISGVFHYWAEGSTDRERWLKALDDLARRSGRPELRRVPWITMGHSTAGIFCRNVAYAWPERVAGVLHIKSGNFHQKDHLPPAGSLAGIPLVAMNGQFETFGPEGGIRPEFGRETQWIFVRKDIEQFKEKDPNHLMSLWLDLGGDHFHGSPELSGYAAAFIRKTAQYRMPRELPAGDGVVRCLPFKLDDGWLTDPDLYNPAHPPAAYKDYTGDKQKALWHYDRETAEAAAGHHKNLGNHQCLSAPALTWMDDGDGWTFRTKAEFLDAMPEQYGGNVAGKKIGRAAGPIVYRSKINEPVQQIGPDTFRLLRPVKAVNIAAVHPGDEQYRATNRWASLTVPAVKGQAQSIDFPPVPDLKAAGGGCDLKARASSGLPVFYEKRQVNDRAVYVSGYASEGLEDVLKDRPGLIRQYPLGKEVQQIAEDVAAGKVDKIAGRPALGRYGAPCLLRMSRDLEKLESGTYLEGWQQVWDKFRVISSGKENVGNFHEFFWQPTSIALLTGGDVLVCHDGGYFRLLTDRDREPAKDNPKLLELLAFYDCCDYVSRLSPDLAQRAWKKPTYTPPVDPEVARNVRDGWPLPRHSNPRTHRMRLDKDGSIFLCGWSASYTGKEPWWSPYLWKLDPKTGETLWTAYQYDPMSGGGNRMGGQVSDTAILTVALEEDGNLLTSLMADGGNTVMAWSPKADTSKFETPIKGKGFMVKLVHWWGQVHRVDAKTREGLGGARIGPWGWVVDMAALPGKNVLAVGRFNGKFDWTPDAWCSESPMENPNAFLRVYSPEFDLTFSTELPGVVPFEVSRIGQGRFILVGRAEKGAAPVKDALVAKAAGATAGYFLIVDWSPDANLEKK